MYKFSPITLDLPLRRLTVHRNGRPIVFSNHTVPPSNCIIAPAEMNKLLNKAVMGYVIQAYQLQSEEQVQEKVLPPEI